MRISKVFPVAADPDTVWAYFQDVPAVATCVPGAELDGRGADGAYEGRITFKMGPMSVSFEGTASLEVEGDRRAARITGKGRDRSGGSRGKLAMEYQVMPADGGSVVEVEADVTLSGPIAQIGRQGLIDEVATRLVSEFVACLESRLEATEGEAAEITATKVGGFRLLFASVFAVLRRLLSRIFGRGAGPEQ